MRIHNEKKEEILYKTKCIIFYRHNTFSGASIITDRSPTSHILEKIDVKKSILRDRESLKSKLL